MAIRTGGGAAPLSLSAKTETKDLYEIGEIPPLGHVPASMYAWVVRKERHGPPEQSMQIEVVPTWPLDSHDVLVMVMAAGVNPMAARTAGAAVLASTCCAEPNTERQSSRPPRGTRRGPPPPSPSGTGT